MLNGDLLQRFLLQQALPDSPTRALNQAAVLLGIEPSQQQLLFTRRAAHLRHHPSQISFPGGKHEPQDDSLFATALREAHEEVGLKATQVQILGRLPQRSTVSGFTITPVVALLHGPLALRADPNEVADVFALPLAPFLNLNRYQQHVFQRKGKPEKVYFIQVEERFIWGATARILHDLAHHCAE